MPDSATELRDPPAAETAGPDAGNEIAGTEIAGTENAGAQPGEAVAADLLVEEVSIDGMCGVY